MKRLFIPGLFLVCLSCPSPLFSQTFLNGGWNLAIADMESLHQMIKDYNHDQPYFALSKRMQEQFIPMGPFVTLGTHVGNINLQGGYSWLSDRTYAEGSDTTGSPQRHDLMVKANSVHIGVGLLLFESGFVNLTPGLTVEYGYFAIYSRVGDEGEMQWDRVVYKPNGYTTLFTRVVVGDMGADGIKLSLKPYYRFSYTKPDISGAKTALGSGAENGKVRTNANAYGLRAGVMLVF